MHKSTPQRTPSHGIRTRTRSAFTLVEMVIVVTLVSVATAMIMPRVDYTAYRVDSGGHAIRSALQRAQAYAVNSQHNELVALDAPNGMLYVVDDVNNNMTVDPGERITAVPLEDGVIFAIPASTWAGAPAPTGAITGQGLTTLSVNGNTLPAFVFRSDGAASTDVQIYLTSKRGAPTDPRGVNITQATGRADWYKNTGGAWILAGF
jgi:prepilin-type N-terminal cleavage/methylation domain-containing protein